MNILPKKRWHVRTKENIARVRRDEAKAAEEEKSRRERIKKAEAESRINHLRHKARKNYDGRSDLEASSSLKKVTEHINFFSDLEDGTYNDQKTNAECEREKKEEQEKYEKQIGYLTYLGQDTNEITGKKSWYTELPDNRVAVEEKIESDIKRKIREDPMQKVKKYLKHKSDDYGMEKHRDKKLKTDCKETSKVVKIKEKSSIEQLRAERLLREQKEKLRTESLLAKIRGDPLPIPKNEPKPVFHQKYNSQYFPELARQNIYENKR